MTWRAPAEVVTPGEDERLQREILKSSDGAGELWGTLSCGSIGRCTSPTSSGLLHGGGGEIEIVGHDQTSAGSGVACTLAVSTSEASR
jgi:hypothetical protein